MQGLAVEGTARVTRGLSTTFAEALIEGVPIGTRFVLDARPVDITNKGDYPARVRCSVEVPDPSQMRAGYEPIPEAAWVSFDTKVHDIEPGGTAKTNVVLFVPDDPSLAGRKFQVMLVLKADPGEGSIMAVGLTPRLLFTVRDKDSEKKKVKVFLNPQVKARVTPYEVVGKEGEIVFRCEAMTAENPWDEVMTYEVIPDNGAITRISVMPHEIVLPDAGWIETSPRIVVLQRYTKAEIAVTARLPLDAVHFGKQYATALRSVVKRKGHEDVEVFNKVTLVVPALSGTAGELEKAK